MKLIQRVGYYLGGFSIGLILLAFFLGGKRASCSYGPEARVIKNINSKPLTYSEQVLEAINNFALDTLQIVDLIQNGDVNFSKSDTSLEPCKMYVIEGLVDNREIDLSVENCEDKAIVQSLKIK